MKLSLNNIHHWMLYILAVIGFFVILWAWALNDYKPGGDPTANLVVLSSWAMAFLASIWYEEVKD